MLNAPFEWHADFRPICEMRPSQNSHPMEGLVPPTGVVQGWMLGCLLTYFPTPKQ
jgi:hypothetical protein